MNIQQVDITGSRLVGAITELGHIGPKHHGIVIGRHPLDGNVYVAENCHTGYQLATVEEFYSRYTSKADVVLHKNDGEFEDVEVANRAIKELERGGDGKYNLATNNCESFSNRAMYNHSNSSQVINTIIGITLIVGTIYYLKRNR